MKSDEPTVPRRSVLPSLSSFGSFSIWSIPQPQPDGALGSLAEAIPTKSQIETLWGQGFGPGFFYALRHNREVDFHAFGDT